MKKLAVMLLAASLSACSSPPSDADAQQAMLQMMTSVVGEKGGDSIKEMFKNVKVSGCKKAEPQGYMCDVSGLMGPARSIRFIKGDKGWTVIQ